MTHLQNWLIWQVKFSLLNPQGFRLFLSISLFCHCRFILSLFPSESHIGYGHFRWLFLWSQAKCPAFTWPGPPCGKNRIGSDKWDLPQVRERATFCEQRRMGNKCRKATTLALSILLFTVLICLWELVRSALLTVKSAAQDFSLHCLSCAST